MGDIRQWLNSLGLDQYADAFENSEIEWNHLPELDHDILKEIGVAVVGHRMTILKAIHGLREARSAQLREPRGEPVATKDTLSGEAERRQLTVMFCDLVGSTALSGQMDPEEYRDVLAAYQSAASKTIRKYDGFIARYMGDGLLVYFGYPQAHEDDPERAVRAGLEVVSAVSAVSFPGDIELRVRIGIATGREGEFSFLEQRWEQARLGEGQAVLLEGEAGIGKSRIAQEFIERIGANVATVLRYQCSPYHTGSAFYPIIDHLQRAAGFVPGDSTDARLGKLETFVRQSLADVKTAVPLLAALLSLPLDANPPLEMTPQRRKAATVEILIALLERLVTRAPVLMVFEDAHWIDPSTREMLGMTIGRIRGLPVLCLVTYRPDFSPPWKSHGHVSKLSLNRMGKTEVGDIVEHLTGGRTLPAEVLDQVVEKTDGVPLFVEELTKTILEEGVLEESNGRYILKGPIRSLTIPATLHDSLMARLDRLAPVKEVAQTAACIGREFSPDLLAEVSPLARNALVDALKQLMNAELVFRRDETERTSYVFKHALVQDAAYESLLVKKRRQVHARIASVLAEQFPDTENTEPERLAHHFTAAGMAEDPIPRWLAAGRRALAGSGLHEAISHLSKALELTAGVDDPDCRKAYELDARTALGAATTALHGWPAIEVRDVVRPACDLFEQGHGHSDAFVNFWNLWTHHACRAEHREGLVVVERMLKHSHERSNTVLEMISLFTAAMAHFWAGNYDLAQIHEREALERYEFERDRDLVWSYNHDPKNTLLSWASHRTWALGYPDQASVLGEAAVAHARRVGHPFNLCWTLGNSSIAYTYSGKYDEARSRIEELRDVARAQDLAFMEAYMVPVNMCAVTTGEGDHETACSEGARAEEIWRSIGGRFFSPVVNSMMAQAYLHLGRSGEAVELMEKTISQVESTGELMCAEEIYRVAGLAQLEHSGDQGHAQELFQKSLDYSRQHGTKSFELRTSICLAKLWCEQGGHQRAHDLLRRICGWFTEGFDTKDIKGARALLEEISRQGRKRLH